MASRDSIRLFTGSTLERYFRRLPVEVHEQCRYHYENDIGPDSDKLIEALRERFRLEPAQLTTVVAITVDAHTTPFRDTAGQTVQGYFVSARIPRHGSKEFLRTPIAPDFKARFRGTITKTAVHFVTHLPSLDLSEFRDEALAEVARTNEALDVFRPQARDYGNRVRDEIERIVRTF